MFELVNEASYELSFEPMNFKGNTFLGLQRLMCGDFILEAPWSYIIRRLCMDK